MAKTPEGSDRFSGTEIDENEEQQRELARQSILHMQHYILQKIDDAKKNSLPQSEKLALKNAIDELQERFIDSCAEENPIIKTVWKEFNQSGEPPKPSKELQARLQQAKEDALAYGQSLHEKYDVDAFAGYEPEAPIEPVKKTFTDFPTKGNIANIPTHKMQTHLEEQEAQYAAFLRIRAAIAPHLDEAGLNAFNEAMEKEIQ